MEPAVGGYNVWGSNGMDGGYALAVEEEFDKKGFRWDPDKRFRKRRVNGDETNSDSKINKGLYPTSLTVEHLNKTSCPRCGSSKCRCLTPEEIDNLTY